MSPRLRSGFTILELFLTIGIFAILLTITISISFNAIARMNLRSSETALIQLVRRAQTQSQQNVKGKQWGLHVDDAGNSIILFSGNTYTTQDGIGATFAVNENIAFSGTLYGKMIAAPAKGLVFKRFTGDPVEPRFSGTIIMNMFGNTRAVTVNGKGVVER